MILKEGLSFLKVFEENSAELQKRQKAHQDLEMIHRELQNYVNSSAEKPQLQEQCSQDRELLSKSDMYATTLKLYPASEYEAWSKRLQEPYCFLSLQVGCGFPNQSIRRLKVCGSLDGSSNDWQVLSLHIGWYIIVVW